MTELYLQGRFPIDRLIEFYPLEEINKAAADSVHGGSDQSRASPERELSASHEATRKRRAGAPLRS